MPIYHFVAKGSESARPSTHKRIHGNFLSVLLRRPFDRSTANSLTAFAQTGSRPVAILTKRTKLPIECLLCVLGRALSTLLAE